MGTDLATTATVHPAELVDDRRAPAPTSTDPRIVTTDRAALLIEEWLVGKAKTTATAYRSDLDAFALAVAELVGAPVTSTPEAVAALLSRSKGEAVTLTTAYRAWMEAPTDDRAELAPATVARRLATLNSLLAAAHYSDLIGWAITLKAPKVAALRDTSGPGTDAVKAMADDLDPSTPSGARDRAIVLLMGGRALRRGELVALDLADVDLDRGTLAVVRKGQTQAELLTVAPDGLDALAAWIDHRGDEAGPLFHGFRGKPGRLNGGSVARIMAKVAKAADVPGTVRPHGLRHTAITEALELTGGDLRAVAQFAGHRNPQTTMVYDDNRTDTAGKVAALLGERLTGSASTSPAGG